MKYIIEAEDFKLVSLNRKYFICRGRNILSTDYRKYKKDLFELFSNSTIPSEPIENPCKTRIEVGTSKDIDNIIKPMHDTLQDCGFIKNDSLIVQTLIKKTKIKRGQPEWFRLELDDCEIEQCEEDARDQTTIEDFL